MTLLQLLYLPNVALASISYLTGVGFSFGAHSVVNGAAITLGQVPALPLVAALPTGVHRDLQYGILFWIALFALLFIFTQLRSASLLEFAPRLLSQGARFFIVVAALAYLAAGELLTSQLNPVGVIWWQLIERLAISFAIAAFVALVIPATIRSVASRE
jgi:hypothetical protein